MKITAKHPFARYVEVYLDGVKEAGVVAADEEAGTIEAYARNPDGSFKPPATEQLKGKVEIRIRVNDDGMTRELLEQVATDPHATSAAKMVGATRWLQASEAERRVLRDRAKHDNFIDMYGGRPRRLRYLGLHLQEVLDRSDGSPILCAHCDVRLHEPESAWHSGDDPTSGWMCVACAGRFRARDEAALSRVQSCSTDTLQGCRAFPPIKTDKLISSLAWAPVPPPDRIDLDVINGKLRATVVGVVGGKACNWCAETSDAADPCEVLARACTNYFNAHQAQQGGLSRFHAVEERWVEDVRELLGHYRVDDRPFAAKRREFFEGLRNRTPETKGAALPPCGRCGTPSSAATCWACSVESTRSDQETVEVCSTSTVLMTVPAGIPVRACDRCNQPVHFDTLAWHSGVDLQTGWVCGTCVPFPSSPSGILGLAKELDVIERTKLTALGVPGEFLKDYSPPDPAMKMTLGRRSGGMAWPACSHCGQSRVPEGKCVVCGFVLCGRCRAQSTSSGECPAQKGTRPLDRWAIEEVARLGRFLTEHFTPEERGGGTDVDHAIRLLEAAHYRFESSRTRATEANAALVRWAEQARRDYEAAAGRYGRAMKTRRFRVDIKAADEKAERPGVLYEFEAAGSGPFYLAVLRASTDEAHDDDLLNANMRQVRSHLPEGCHLIILSPGAEFTVAELVATDPLPYDAVRRFPGVVETTTCGRCSLTADSNWAGWWTVARDGCLHLCAHCYATERPEDYSKKEPV